VKRAAVHLALFAAACVTTTMVGGPTYAATLLGILLTHEMGHYVVARRHGIDVSLPYFIPVPFALGTMGAVIRMRTPIPTRDALIDVGAAGPLAGLVVAVPLLVWGLAESPVTPIPAGGAIEGNSLGYLLVKLVVTGRILPGGGVDVQLSPMAMAAWVGLLVTFINLLPIGQLDGGHIAAAYFGDRHERNARVLHPALGAVGVVVGAALFVEARAAGRGALGALAYALAGAVPWLVWLVLVALMRRATGGRYHPPVGDEPLSRGRRVLFWVMVGVFLLLVTPVPMREALP